MKQHVNEELKKAVEALGAPEEAAQALEELGAAMQRSNLTDQQRESLATAAVEALGKAAGRPQDRAGASEMTKMVSASGVFASDLREPLKRGDTDEAMAVAKRGQRGGRFSREQVSDAMTAVAQQKSGDLDPGRALAWLAEEEPEVFAAWDELHRAAPVSTMPGIESQDDVTKAARQKFPDLSEPEAVAEYLETPAGAEHYGRLRDGR